MVCFLLLTLGDVLSNPYLTELRHATGAYEGDAAIERRASPPGDAVSHTNTLKRYLEKASRSFQMLPTDSDHVRLAASPASQQYFSLTPL